MSNAIVFQKIEAREITASEGAKMLLAEDAARRAARRPAWAPKWAWVVGGFVLVFLLGLVGIQRESS